MANRLFFTLKEKGIRQEALADALGVAPATVSRWCSNLAQPSPALLYQISAFFKIGVHDLLYCQARAIKLSPDTVINLSTLGCNDAYLAMVFGKSKLTNIDSAILRFTTKIDKTTISTPLLVLSSIYQNPDIPVIEVNRLINNCKSTKLTLENCKEEITISFACPNFASTPTDEIAAEKIII